MEGPEDQFHEFGDGFKGFPKRLPEDCVECSLFIIDNNLKSQKELLARLEAVRKEAIKLADSLLDGYIWQRESFNLEVASGNGRMHLKGVTNYGDSVEDEWLIVYIIKELSNRCSDLWIKVVDTDGEFLLIEAANALPRWLNPEVAENRVWIHRNKLRIIPLSAASQSSFAKSTASISRSLNIEEALEAISSTSDIIIHSPLIEEEAFYRLRNYPSQIKDSLHHSPITIPRKLAYVLHTQRETIAPAVESFYLRDPIALKPLQSKPLKPSDLFFFPADLVTISVRFTKVLFAQLKSQEFSPPLVWRDILANAQKRSTSDDIERKVYERLEMGMKVTSGFEMLATDPKNEDNRNVRKLKILLEDLDVDGSESLPTDNEIAKWTEVKREDDEKWLDINFEDFERELDGKNKGSKSKGAPGAFGPEPPSGFGDAKTQADLQKMVERFEAFLNDDDAGIDGATLDDMDVDDDDDDDDDDDNEDSEDDFEDEDREVSFDEEEFAKMMKEMMGMPLNDNEKNSLPGAAAKAVKNNPAGSSESDDEYGGVNEAEEIRKVMRGFEAELKEAGAFNLDPAPKESSALSNKTSEGEEKENANANEESESDDDINIDFNLAKNMLESFKSQAGMAGPGGNLMGMMGIQLPRDEGDAMSDGRRR